MDPRPRGRPRKSGNDAPLTVSALERGLSVLNELATSGPQILTDLHLRLGLPAPTVYRLLTTLRMHGFVHYDEHTRRWSVGVRSFEIGQKFVGQRDVVGLARPRMDDLMAATGATVSLALVVDQEIIFVAQVEPRSSIRAFFPPGEKAPLHASGCGKAVIATWSDERISDVLGGKELDKFTSKTLTNVQDIQLDASGTRQRGWSVNDGEHTEGMCCVAAPIFDSSGKPIAAMSISWPIERIKQDKIYDIGCSLRERAFEITNLVGGNNAFYIKNHHYLSAMNL